MTTVDLPPLVGTPRQIEWAERIRAEALADPRNRPPSAPRAPTPEEIARFGALIGKEIGTGAVVVDDIPRRIEAVHNLALAARRRLETEIRAAWWLDNQDQVRGYVDEARREEIRAQIADIKAREMQEPAGDRPSQPSPSPTTRAALAIQTIPFSGGCGVRFPRDERRNARFREQFPKAYWSQGDRAWIVRGKTASRDVALWAEVEMRADKIAIRAAQDAEIDRMFGDLP